MSAISGMDLGGAFRLANIGVGALTVVGGLTQLGLSLQDILLSFYLIIFGYSIASLEFATPPVAHKYGSFLFSFVGRGILYILIAAILMSGGFFRYLISFIIFGIGALFVVLEFIPSIEPPENMRNEPLDYMEEV
ncbi:Golgi apparatus membrane protein TVP15 [Yarrowia lipolytica]|nr:Golgi apparatus membrane protein TVP15 [Yarrowia lipolytica]KAE8173932.1 Golgi apparatus membrane protein TVP15 [Yarrowia lipolytica]KAJ8053095.1 Golgi apparatus membrane protein TVP15 [Yarrowia lipolytica]QNP97436.1 Golgi apparatus membrane protein tvp15 [Yarrowia lipolytica]RDW26357.1 Golgi apparatus membrane protein TVP15 [Yarrowia lipolytica]